MTSSTKGSRLYHYRDTYTIYSASLLIFLQIIYNCFMQQRREVWARLSKETRNFVTNYLQNNLKLKESEFDNFLFPEYEKTLLNAKAMYGMDRAVDRILTALSNGEKICIYGDYDCDGVPGTALVRDFFQKINYHNVIYYIPHRHTEGYGLNKLAIEKIYNSNLNKEIEAGDVVLDPESDIISTNREDKVTLMITIDLGTTNVDEIDFANSLGMDVIVTDHHLPLETEDGQILPKAYAIINNKQVTCNYTNKDLCGSGTVFKLVCEILSSLKLIKEHKQLPDESNKKSSLRSDVLSNSSTSVAELLSNFNWKNFEKQGIVVPPNGYEKWLLDLVAIATIADMVPLTNENRTLAIYGLHVLSKTNRAGLQTVFKNAKTNLQKVNETDISFTVAPRINSASRMAHPRIALSMFSQNLKEGIDAAHELEDLNTSRKETTKNIVKSIYKTLEERIENSPDKKLPEIVVIGSKSWNAGVLGILASKVLEKYNVNVFCFGEDESDENNFKGSCRSRGDIHLVKLMTLAKDNFGHFGGHELAGGFSISFENLHTLENVLNEIIEHARIENEVAKKKQDSIKNVIEISLSQITPDLLAGLNLIGPFGVGNPKPIFAITNILENKIERFGKSKEHIKLKLIGKNNFDRKIETEAIKFFVEKSEEECLYESFKNGKLFYEVEPGFMSSAPRLKIIN